MVLYGGRGKMQPAPASWCLYVHPQSGAGGLPAHAPAGAAADQAYTERAHLSQHPRQDLEATARHLGHSKLETTRIYAKWSDRQLRETIGRW
jgi:hypothetical protein